MLFSVRFLAVLGLALLFALPAPAQSQAGPAPDDDPENVLLVTLKDGVVVIQMRPDLAPNHVRRIKQLVRKKFYDGVPFHRVIPGELAQTGDPTGTGAGGSGQMIPGEFSHEHHVRGTVSMARAEDVDSADSQWFICLRPLPGLDGGYTIWGKVIRGMEFVNHIKTGSSDEDGRVSDPDRILTMRVEADVYKAR